MKRFIPFVLILTLLLAFTSCVEPDETLEQILYEANDVTIEQTNEPQRIGNFIIIESYYSNISIENYGYYSGQRYITHLVYDEETKVMYSIVSLLDNQGGDNFVITKLYNPDDTPRIFIED